MKTNEELIKKLVIGTVQFGLNYGISNSTGQTGTKEVGEILNFARSNGISCLDTARAYGVSEKVLGEQDLQGFEVVSKFKLNGDFGTIDQQLKDSLANLNKNSLYGYLAHDGKDILNSKEDIWPQLQDIRKQGIVTKIGYSLYEPAELELLLEVGCVPDLIQIPMSLFDQRFVPYLADIKERGIEVHTRSAFLQGLYFMEGTRLSSFFDEIKEPLDLLKELYPSHSERAAALIWECAKHKEVDKVVIGVNDLDQLKSNIEGISLMQTKPSFENFTQQVDNKILMPSHWPNK